MPFILLFSLSGTLAARAERYAAYIQGEQLTYPCAPPASDHLLSLTFLAYINDIARRSLHRIQELDAGASTDRTGAPAA